MMMGFLSDCQYFVRGRTLDEANLSHATKPHTSHSHQTLSLPLSVLLAEIKKESSFEKIREFLGPLWPLTHTLIATIYSLIFFGFLNLNSDMYV